MSLPSDVGERAELAGLLLPGVMQPLWGPDRHRMVP